MQGWGRGREGKREEVAVRAGRVFTDAAPLLLGSADSRWMSRLAALASALSVFLSDANMLNRNNKNNKE